MENNPKISVCVPTYNRSAYLHEAITSILNQTFDDFELVIVDNNSSDNTKEIVFSFSDERIKYFVNKNNIGMVGNWNRCIDLARGKYIIIFHDDDIMIPTMLQEEVHLLDMNPQIGLVFSSVILDMQSRERIIRRPYSQNMIFNSREAIIGLWEKGCPIAPSLRKDAFQKTGYFDEKAGLSADFDMWLKISCHYSIGFLKEPLTVYRIHQNNLSHTMRGDSVLKSFKQIQKNLEEHLEKYQKKLIKKEELFSLYYNFLFMFCRGHIFKYKNIQEVKSLFDELISKDANLHLSLKNKITKVMINGLCLLGISRVNPNLLSVLYRVKLMIFKRF